MREILIKNNFGHRKGTQWRGHEIQRIEAFTDAVFAFAVTLLAVSLEVPRSFGELWEAMKGFVGFALTFSFLFYMWFQHYNFFRKYGLDDKWMIILNGTFLVAVLFFIYPLKFISYLVVTMIFDFTDDNMHRIMSIKEVPVLFSLYFVGWAVLSLTFALMYRHALKYRLHLKLNTAEELEALQRYAFYMFSVLMMIIGVALYAAIPEKFLSAFSIVFIALPIMRRLIKNKRVTIGWLMPKAAAEPQEA